MVLVLMLMAVIRLLRAKAVQRAPSSIRHMSHHFPFTMHVPCVDLVTLKQEPSTARLVQAILHPISTVLLVSISLMWHVERVNISTTPRVIVRTVVQVLTNLTGTFAVVSVVPVLRVPLSTAQEQGASGTAVVVTMVATRM